MLGVDSSSIMSHRVEVIKSCQRFQASRGGRKRGLGSVRLLPQRISCEMVILKRAHRTSLLVDVAETLALLAVLKQARSCHDEYHVDS